MDRDVLRVRRIVEIFLGIEAVVILTTALTGQWLLALGFALAWAGCFGYYRHCRRLEAEVLSIEAHMAWLRWKDSRSESE